MKKSQFQLNFDTELKHWWFVARRQIVKNLIAEVLPPSPKALIVDVGCGTGANIASLAADYSVAGIDPSGEAIAMARSRYPAVRFIEGWAPGDLDDSQRAANMFLLNDVLEHAPDDFELISSLLHASRPGSYMLLTVPADRSLWTCHDENHAHYRRYDRARFEALWAGLPVTPLLVSHFNTRLYPLIKAVRTVNRLRGGCSGEAGTDVKMPSAPVNRLLSRIFAGESGSLNRMLVSPQARPYRRGVSLLALLRRDAGEIAIRRKPEGIAPDYFDPQAARDSAAASG